MRTGQARANMFEAHSERLPPEYITSGSSMVIAPWDQNVDFRADELSNNRDSAYIGLMALVLELLTQTVSKTGSVLDAGCGLGYLSDAIATAGFHVVGVDPSRHSIEYATKRFNTIDFHTRTLEQYAADDRNASHFDAVVANMVMHATPQLDTFVTSAARVLRPGGSFIVTVPHPCFFLTRVKAASAPPDYSEQCGLMIPFRIHGGRAHPEHVPYFHRTIETYSEAINRAGLKDLRIREPRQIGNSRRHDMLAIFASRRG